MLENKILLNISRKVFLPCQFHPVSSTDIIRILQLILLLLQIIIIMINNMVKHCKYFKSIFDRHLLCSSAEDLQGTSRIDKTNAHFLHIIPEQYTRTCTNKVNNDKNNNKKETGSQTIFKLFTRWMTVLG